MTAAPRRSLIVTGVTGFVGRHVVAEAVSRGYEVHGIARTESSDSVREMLTSLHVLDLRNKWPAGLTADAVVHLAGLAAVGPSFDEPQRYITDNSAMMTAVGEAALAGAVSGRAVIVSTGAVYKGDGSVPLTEDAPLLAASPYAVSKLVVERQAEYYHHRGVDMVIARPFNHIGPGQERGFLVPDLYATLSSLQQSSPLPIGNLATRRDYTDVRDIAGAYVDLVEADVLEHTAYNVCSGRALSGLDVLEMLCAAMGREVPQTVTDPGMWRPNDAEEITGASDRIRSELGWRPRSDARAAINDFVREMKEHV